MNVPSKPVHLWMHCSICTVSCLVMPLRFFNHKVIMSHEHTHTLCLIRRPPFCSLKASTVPSGSTPSTTATLQIEAGTLTRGSSASRNEPSPAALTLPPSEAKKNQQDTAILTGILRSLCSDGTLLNSDMYVY